MAKKGVEKTSEWFDKAGVITVWIVIIGCTVVSMLYLYQGVQSKSTPDGLEVSGTVVDFRTDGHCKVAYTNPITKQNTHTFVKIASGECVEGLNVRLEMNADNTKAFGFVENKTLSTISFIISAVCAIVAAVLYHFRNSPWVQGGLFVGF